MSCWRRRVIGLQTEQTRITRRVAQASHMRDVASPGLDEQEEWACGSSGPFLAASPWAGWAGWGGDADPARCEACEAFAHRIVRSPYCTAAKLSAIHRNCCVPYKSRFFLLLCLYAPPSTSQEGELAANDGKQGQTRIRVSAPCSRHSHPTDMTSVQPTPLDLHSAKLPRNKWPFEFYQVSTAIGFFALAGFAEEA